MSIWIYLLVIVLSLIFSQKSHAFLFDIFQVLDGLFLIGVFRFISWKSELSWDTILIEQVLYVRMMLDYWLALVIKGHIFEDGFVTPLLNIIIYNFSCWVITRLPIHYTIICVVCSSFFLHRLHFIHHERFHSTSHLLPLFLLSIFDHDCFSVFREARLLLRRERHWWIMFRRELDRFVSILHHNIQQVIANLGVSLIRFSLALFCNGRFLAFGATFVKTEACTTRR